MSTQTGPGDTARLYHRLSSYSYLPEDAWPNPYMPPPIAHPLVLQDFVALAPGRLPPLWKAYPHGLASISLPRQWPLIGASATAVLSGRHVSPPAAIDLPGLARLLHLSAGIVRVRPARPSRRSWVFRAAGSAGGLFPLEIYVSARRVAGLPDGVYWYNPADHALLRVGPSAGGEATTLVVTGIPWRTGWKYAERGFRHIYWDGGSMLAQALVLADSAGFRPRLWTRFPDAEVASVVGADGVQEFPLALVTLGDGEPSIRPGGRAATGSIGDDPDEFPLVTLAQRAGDMDTIGDPWPGSPALASDGPAADDLDTVILRRGSTRRMDPSSTVDRQVFDFSLAASLRGAKVPHFIAVHGVDGVDPGLYRWPDLERPLRRGSLRHELLLACWDQDLGRDAAFVVMGALDIERIDDRTYREAQLEAGIVEGRLHLAAFGLGVGASGMTFLDDEIEPLLGAPLAALLFTCVGVPTYAGKAGGMPGAPVSIVTPAEGETPRDPKRPSKDS